MILEKGESHLKDWIREVGMSGRMQSALTSALRGADADDSPEVKRVVRWIRHTCVKEVNPTSHFLRDCEFVDIKAMINQDSWQWDRLKTHFWIHVQQAMEIIAYFHPNEWIAAKAKTAYEHTLIPGLPGLPESKSDLIARLHDSLPIARGDLVINDWVFQLPGVMQSTLECAIRGSDIATDNEIRRVTRWMRWVVMKNVHPTSHFMEDRDFRPIAEVNKETPWIWGNLPNHFVHHLGEALEVVGYLHPDEAIKARAFSAYTDLCKKSKIKPEPREILIQRMQDKPGHTYEVVQQQTNLPVG